MITVVCGDDQSASRNYFASLRLTLEKKNLQAKFIKPEGLAELNNWIADTSPLFAKRNIFFTENLNKEIKKSDRLLDEVTKIAKNDQVDVYVWEDEPARFLKIKNLGNIKEFKPSKNIFKLVESFYPGNKSIFLNMLADLAALEEPIFILQMIVRQVRNLILAKENITPLRMQSWQVARLRQQAVCWRLTNLILAYESLFSIEINLKSNGSPATLTDSLDILACLFL